MGLKIMPAVVEMYPAQIPPEARRKYTRDDCRALEAAGLLEVERFELIDGELIRKMPKSPLHSLALYLVVEWLRGVFGPRYVMQEVSINLSPVLDSTNELEPDAILIRRPVGAFREVNADPADILFVAEVSVTTQEFDLGIKAARYASAGIAEYWVLDLRQMQIVVHRNPMGERYESVVAYAADEPVAPLAAERASVCLRDLVRAD